VRAIEKYRGIYTDDTVKLQIICLMLSFAAL